MAHIEIKNLSFKYKTSEKNSLSDVSFTINKGDFVVLCGKSGCGKTTLLKCLKPNIMPAGKTEGEILLESRNIESLTDREQEKKIGFVMQNPEYQIVTDKVWHELAFGLESMGEKNEIIRSKVAEIAEYFDITDLYNENTDNLSGGQKQLVNLAAVMIMNPEILVLDEPTSQLDPIAAERFMDIVSKINEDFGITVIISEHRLDYLLKYANKLVVMEEGKLVQCGCPQEVLREALNMEVSPLMPIPSRIFNGHNGAGQIPISTKEGRSWLINYISDSKDESFFSKRNFAEKKSSEYKSYKKDENLSECKSYKKDEDLNERKSLNLGFPTSYNNEKNMSVVNVKDVWFRYEKMSRDIIKGLNLHINKGEIFSVIGGNGTGKTTTTMLLSGILKPYRGKIKVRGKIGFLPQDVQILFEQESVMEELKKVDKSLIEKMNLQKLLNMHPYDLSGGEQQKVALAKVLGEKPAVLLLDEPTKGIDNIYKEQLGILLRDLAENGKTIILVSHDLDFCGEYSDRCGLFAQGSLISEDTAREFFLNNRFYTTTIAKLARGIIDGAYKMEDML